METLFNKEIKKDLNKLERARKGSASANPVARPARNTIAAVIGSSLGAGSSTTGNTNASGLESPLTMDVLLTKTVNIPVPTGASSVDVQVVQKYKLTDASGEEFEVTVQDYP